jgi:hypothetical protein
MGPFWSGKSTLCVIDSKRGASLQRPRKDAVRRSRSALVHDTYPELKRMTMKSRQQWVNREPSRWVDESLLFHHIKVDDVYFEVLFVGLDHLPDIRIC